VQPEALEARQGASAQGMRESCRIIYVKPLFCLSFCPQCLTHRTGDRVRRYMTLRVIIEAARAVRSQGVMYGTLGPRNNWLTRLT
jgi:biotin synthase-like enzyme